MTGSLYLSLFTNIQIDKELTHSEEVKPTLDTKGKLDNKEMTLSEVKSWFFNYQNNFKCSGEGTDKEFCLLANGFWQAEGYIGGIFRSGINFYPICTATQYLSEASVRFFLRLDNALSNKGTFSITLNNKGKFVIIYRLSGWNTLFSVFIPYFYMLYGAKFQAISKLKKMYDLIHLIKNNSNIENVIKNKVLIVKLAYSLTAHSSRYKVSIEDKLISLNLDPALLKTIPDFNFSENSISPCFLFILGFFLGDGTLHLKLDWKPSNSTIVITPSFFIAQSNVESNKHVMEIMTTTLSNMGLKAYLSNKATTFELTVKGLDNVFICLFKFLEKYHHFLYWKVESFNLLSWTKNLVGIGGHHTYFGLKALIDKVYSSNNERFTDKEVWLTRLDIWLKAVSERRNYGEYYITSIYSSNKQLRGWQVRFPTSLKLPKSNKAFLFSTCGGQDKAFLLAVEYRDKILSEWINEFIDLNN